MYEELRLKLAEALKAGSKRLLATYLQTLLAYPDGRQPNTTSPEATLTISDIRKPFVNLKRREWTVIR